MNLNWRNSTSMYANRDTVHSHVESVIAEFKGLIPRLDTFTFDNGVSAQLLSLFGTLEITFKNRIYNIPISIWLQLNYPLSAPIMFVKPTPNMLIRTSKYVDSQGKIYHPQLAYWKPDSSLVKFLRVLQQVFSQEPPVYAKPANMSPAAVHSTSTRSMAGNSSHSNTVTGNASHTIANRSSTTSSGSPSQGHGGWRPRQVQNSKEDEISRLRMNLTAKITQKSLGYSQMMEQASQEQISVNRKLMESQKDVDSCLNQLDISCNNLKQNIQVLVNVNKEIVEAIKVIENTPDPDVNVIAENQAVLCKQIFDAVAEARAIDDCIYHLKNSFNADNLDINVFIKTLKSLAREEFFKKALILKIRSHLGLKEEL